MSDEEIMNGIIQGFELTPEERNALCRARDALVRRPDRRPKSKAEIDDILRKCKITKHRVEGAISQTVATLAVLHDWDEEELKKIALEGNGFGVDFLKLFLLKSEELMISFTEGRESASDWALGLEKEGIEIFKYLSSIV